MKIAFLDTLGLPYDPTVLDRRGLGGSESAVINIAYELAKLGNEVVVFNRCGEDDTKTGSFGEEASVEYRNIKNVWYPGKREGYDIVISSRSLLPFSGDADFKNILENNPYKILYMHDTFCQGSDHVLEQMVVDKKVDTIFTLSDFHTDYVTTCNHGHQRNFETLKHHIFQTRNGAVCRIKEVDILAKDPNLFVFNASYTKGMSALVRDIWPRFKQHNPKAKLTVIGGFYRFPDRVPDQQEKDWRELSEQKHYDVTFTGVITQKEIAHILAKASYFVALGGFPETFGISILEALLYNTPIICNRFGAAEETAPDLCSYKLDYAVEPNSLWPNINKAEQIRNFVRMMDVAYHNKYLWQQKAYACNMVKPIAGWDTIARQWDQHFAHHFGCDDKDPETVWINQRVHKIFNRRFANAEDFI